MPCGTFRAHRRCDPPADARAPTLRNATGASAQCRRLTASARALRYRVADRRERAPTDAAPRHRAGTARSFRGSRESRCRRLSANRTRPATAARDTCTGSDSPTRRGTPVRPSGHRYRRGLPRRCDGLRPSSDRSTAPIASGRALPRGPASSVRFVPKSGARLAAKSAHGRLRDRHRILQNGRTARTSPHGTIAVPRVPPPSRRSLAVSRWPAPTPKMPVPVRRDPTARRTTPAPRAGTARRPASPSAGTSVALRAIGPSPSRHGSTPPQTAPRGRPGNSRNGRGRRLR